MQVEAQNYFDLIVQPTCESYFTSPWDFRLAALSMIVAHHMVDYWAMGSYTGAAIRRGMQSALDASRVALVKEYPDLAPLGDAADSMKHGRLAQNRVRFIGASDELRTTPGLFNAPFGQGQFAGATSVYFDTTDGRRVWVKPLLINTVDFWRSKLASARII